MAYHDVAIAAEIGLIGETMRVDPRDRTPGPDRVPVLERVPGFDRAPGFERVPGFDRAAAFDRVPGFDRKPGLDGNPGSGRAQMRDQGRAPDRGRVPGDLRDRRSGAVPGDHAPRRMPVILLLGNEPIAFDAMREMCDFLDIALERVEGDTDVLPFLERYEPMALVTAMDSRDQDGANVLMSVAQHDRGLPVLLVTDNDPVLAGAVDAVVELWGLTEVTQTDFWPAPGELAEFMCRAGVKGRCLALLPI